MGSFAAKGKEGKRKGERERRKVWKEERKHAPQNKFLATALSEV